MNIPGFFDASDFDILRVIQSQYAGSPRLKAMTVTCWSLLNPEDAIRLMYEHMIDPWTADGAGLDVWGRIVAISRRIYVSGESVILDDETYRMYMFVKALFNLTNSTLQSINYICSLLIESGVKVLHTDTMVLTILVTEIVNPQALQAFINLHWSPTGVGVKLYYATGKIFGFKGSKLHPFNQANFIPSGPIDLDV